MSLCASLYVKTPAGNGCPGDCDAPEFQASFTGPEGVSVSKDEQYVVVADYGNNKIRKMVISSGEVTTIVTGHKWHHPMGVVVGRNALLRLPALDAEAARAQLTVLLATWAEGMRWPLPLPPALALQWLHKPQAGQALLDLYEGADFQRAERDKDPALSRTYPTLSDLLATGAFERLAEAVYAPLRDWAAQAEVLPLAEVTAPTEAAAAAVATQEGGA